MQHRTELSLATRPAEQARISSAWPGVVPHPLDYDWRFTRPTVGLIWETIAALAAPQRGIALLEQSLQLEPNNPTAMYQLSLAYAVVRNIERARAVALQLAQVAPTFPGLSQWMTTIGIPQR